MTLANGRFTFAEVFPQYYAIVRGQADNLPVFGSPEYTTAIHLGNNAIQEWERADGTLWRELTDLLSTRYGTGTISTGTQTYDAAEDMRKPPDYIVLSGTTTGRIPVVETHDVKNLSDLSSYAYFTGGPNTGFQFIIPSAVATNNNGATFDYTYYRKAAYLTTATDPAGVAIDMSDPNFMIHSMAAARAENMRNDFLYNISRNRADTALVNMKIENSSRGYNDGWNDSKLSGAGFGKTSGTSFFSS